MLSFISKFHQAILAVAFVIIALITAYLGSVLGGAAWVAALVGGLAAFLFWYWLQTKLLEYNNRYAAKTSASGGKGALIEWWQIFQAATIFAGFFAVDPLLQIFRDGTTWADYEWFGGGSWLVLPVVGLAIWLVNKLIARAAGFKG